MHQSLQTAFALNLFFKWSCLLKINWPCWFGISLLKSSCLLWTIQKEAEVHLPELKTRDGISIPMEDIGTSRVWNMRYR